MKGKGEMKKKIKGKQQRKPKKSGVHLMIEPEFEDGPEL